LFYHCCSKEVMLFRGMLFWEKSVFGQKLFDQKQNNISFGKATIEQNSRIDGYAREKIILGNNVKLALVNLYKSQANMVLDLK
jgi:hypothetical protein